MSQKAVVLLSTFLLLLIFISSGYCIPFSVSGSAVLLVNGNLKDVGVSGFISIDEPYFSGSYVDGVPDLSDSGYMRTNYTFFDINIGSNNYTGSGFHDTYFYNFFPNDSFGIVNPWDAFRLQSFDDSLVVEGPSRADFYDEKGIRFDEHTPSDYFELPSLMVNIDPLFIDHIMYNDELTVGQIHSLAIERVGNSPSSPVPEPSTLALFFLGISGLVYFKRR